MFDLPLIMLLIQTSEYEQLLGILETILATHTSMTISEDDRQHLVKIFVFFHQKSMQYPENSIETPAKDKGVAQVRSPRPSFFSPLSTWAHEQHLVTPMSPQIFSPRVLINKKILTDRAIMRCIYKILRSSEPVTQTRRFSLMDLFFEDAHAKLDFLHNIIIQELFFEHLQIEGYPYYQRLLTDLAFLTRVGRAINLNLIRGDYGQSLLTSAIQARCSNEIFALLIHLGADVNGARVQTIFSSPIHPLRSLHHEQDLFGHRSCTRPMAIEAKIYIRYEALNPITQALYTADLPKALYLIQHPLFQISFLSLPNFISEAAPRASSPLMIAAYYGDTAIVRALIARGVDIDARDNSGESALFYALRGNQLESVCLLIEAGANLQFRNGSNHTIFDLIEIFQYPEILEYFSLILPLHQMGLQ